MNNSLLSRVRSVISITCVVVLVCVITAPTLSAQSLPSPWVTGDVGNPAGQGSAAFSNETFRVNAVAGDIGSQGDQFTFVQRKLTGDGVIIARVRAAQSGDALAKAGVMIRESLDPQSRHVFAVATGSGAVRFQRRSREGGPGVQTNAGTGAAPWLKVERRGATFTAFRSSDGVTWRQIGTEIVPMADTVFVGLAVTAGATTAATADFSTVSVTETAPLVAAATTPPGWSSADVGLPALAGSEQENGGILSVTGGGVDVGGVSDQFHYMYQQISGDVNIVTRVTAVQFANAASKGGIMIRDSLTPNGAHASMFMTAGNGPAFVQRAAAGGLATSTPTGTMAAPLWLKLELRADMVTAFQSADGLAWTTVGAVRLSLPSPYYIGWAVSSQDPLATATATFDNMMLSVPSAQNQPPTISLTAPDTSLTYDEPATITISAAAADTDGTISSVDFFEGSTLLGSTSIAPYSFTWSDVPEGLYTFSAVAHDNDGAATTSDLRSVSVRPPFNPRPTVALTSPADGATFTAPATVTVSADASDINGSVTRVDFYAGSTLIGSSSAAPYSVTWSSVAADVYTLTAVATDNGGATRTSAARTITVNARPTVSLTAPANGATFQAPANIVISANASDADGTVTQVTFSAGTTVIGTDTTSPYSVTWSNVPGGTYVLKAVATDNDGATKASATRSITVSAAGNQAPTASLTAPANGATFTAPATITVSATASDTDGTIAEVDFFAGTTLIGTDTTSPYSVTWSNVGAGTYSLTAVATDNGGATTTSAARSITVTGTGVPAPWQQTDIGSPSAPGGAQYSNGTFTIDGRGNLWKTPDQFHYVYQAFSGDITITAHVVSMENTNGWAKAGVMIRETLAADAADAAMVLTAGNGANFFSRSTTGAASQEPVSVGSGTWVRLERRGTTITGSQSIDGVAWTAVGSMTLGTASMFVGLAVSSDDPTLTATHVLDNVMTSLPAANQAPTVALTAPANGATFTAPATVTVSATASDTDGTLAKVDFFAGATLIGSDTTSPYSITWNNVAAGSYSLTAVATDDDGATTTSAARTITVSAAANQAPTVALTAPANGATFTAPATVTVSATASDTDGTLAKVDFFAGTTLIGSDTTSPYSVTWNNVAAGSYSLTAVATDDDGATTTSAARTITVNGANQAPTVALTAPANGATFTAPATVTVSATASDTDGTVAKVDFFAGTTLIGSDTTSPYSVTWSNVGAGSYSLTAVATDNGGATTTSAARTITVNAAANQAPTASLTAPANGATFTAPATVTVSATASDTDGTVAKVDFFAGTTLIGSDTTSPYSVTWSNVGAGTYSLTAVATDNGGATTTSAARSITVTGTGVPAPWQQTDIGSPSAPGGAQYSNGSFTIDGRGNLWKTPDQFHYVYQAFSGDITITAHVVSMENTNGWAKAGVMIRETLAADAADAAMVLTAGNGANFFSRSTTGAASQEPVSVGSGTWVRLERRGTTITGSQSIDGVAWTAVGSMTLGTTSMFVGLAVSSDDPTLTATHVLDNVMTSLPAANQAPTVALTAPANGATFTAPATVTVSATASDTDGTLAKVDFFAGATLIGSDTTSPYSITWNNVAAGSYSLTAVATDDDGATTTSAARTITVSAAANQAPTVALTAPANGATFTAPATVTVSATASDTDGTVAKVDFFAGTTLIGSDTTSPYSITWNNVAAGSYSLTAVATDDDGATTTSAARTITVSAAGNQAPTASLTAPANGATFTAPATITVSATASDTDGTIAKVDFFAGTTLIGTDTTSPYSVTWSNVGAGTYSLTAVATDNGGATTTSAARTVTVSAAPPPASAHAVFTASVDHASVTNYVLEIFASGANPNTATPIASQNLGKPPVVNGDCDADISQTFNSLPAGSYIGTVSAVGSGGSSRSAATSFSK